MPSSNSKGSGSGSSTGRDNSINKSSSGSNSNYGMVKDGWGSRPNFQASYGLGMTPEGIEEGNAILDKMREYDNQGNTSGKK
ncbi:hypothetical protein N0V93_009292 [Gnomoniopsis smithogilvyi]|uniref:Uncharacterized protein n=1 Tax=Gnomoniopsis smithogilvyi TaxID=1191159 RepID=A0A9W9CTJ7_9PEZI|nr:hypothetical protein N0V93_009292 [Gnomoniopsis smithogilvyi]